MMPSARRLRYWSARRLPDTRENPRPHSIAWLASYPGVREHGPLRRHGWYGIGGNAKYFIELADDAELPQLVGRVNRDQVPYLVIGAGTNTLFASDELPGLTIKLSTARISIDGDAVVVSAGTLMPKLAAETARAGRAGLEFAAGGAGAGGGLGVWDPGGVGGG